MSDEPQWPEPIPVEHPVILRPDGKPAAPSKTRVVGFAPTVSRETDAEKGTSR